MLPKPNAIFFDLDDTILNLSHATEQVWRTLCTQFAPSGVDATQLKQAIDDTREQFWRDPQQHQIWRMKLQAARAEIAKRALQQFGVHDAEALGWRMSRATDDLLYAHIQPFAGAIETVQSARAHGIKLALITNGASEPQRRKIKQFDLAQYFEVMVIEGEFGVGKPDPRVYEHALRECNVQPCDVWMVGDRLEWEVAAPQRLGMAGIWVDVKCAGLAADSNIQPNLIVCTISELRAIFEDSNE